MHTVADQFAEILAEAVIKRIYGIVGDKPLPTKVAVLPARLTRRQICGVSPQFFGGASGEIRQSDFHCRESNEGCPRGT
jgi:hypothetical protein